MEELEKLKAEVIEELLTLTEEELHEVLEFFRWECGYVKSDKS